MIPTVELIPIVQKKQARRQTWPTLGVNSTKLFGLTAFGHLPRVHGIIVKGRRRRKVEIGDVHAIELFWLKICFSYCYKKLK